MTIRALLEGLVGGDVQFVVVGGVAGAMQGSPFATNDLDVCYESGRGNVSRLAHVVAQWSPYPRGWESGLSFTMDSRTLRTTPIMTLRTAEGDLDLLDRIDGVGSYDDVLVSSEEVNAFAMRFRVLTLDALIRARRGSARPKDLAQLPTLEALLDLRRDEDRP
jgi:hypothetical protein